MYYDSHCHLDDSRFDADRAEVIERAAQVGVTALMVPGVSASTWQALPRLQALAPRLRLRFAVGVHPFESTRGDAATLEHDVRLAAITLGAAAIGECGLDQRRPNIDVQTQVFAAQVRAAVSLDLPLILHVVGLHDAALRILATAPRVRGVVHSYSGSAEIATAYLKRGLMLSFSGSVTSPNARRLRQAAARAPDDAYLLESDAPDQAPWTLRGQRNEPQNLPRIAMTLAELRGTSLDQVARETYANADRLFGLSQLGH